MHCLTNLAPHKLVHWTTV